MYLNSLRVKGDSTHLQCFMGVRAELLCMGCQALEFFWTEWIMWHQMHDKIQLHFNNAFPKP